DTGTFLSSFGLSGRMPPDDHPLAGARRKAMTISRRKALRLGPLALLGAMLPGPAWARRVRVLDAPSTEKGTVPLTPGALPEPPRAVTRLRVGPATRHGSLQVFWLHATESDPPLSIATLEEARASGAVGAAARQRAQA